MNERMEGWMDGWMDGWILYKWIPCSVELFSHVWLFVTHEPQHARPPCPTPTPRVHPNPCPLSQWCHPTISSSSCPLSFPASGSFQMSQLFTSGGQSIGVSASTLVFPMNTQDWSPVRCNCSKSQCSHLRLWIFISKFQQCSGYSWIVLLSRLVVLKV